MMSALLVCLVCTAVAATAAYGSALVWQAGDPGAPSAEEQAVRRAARRHVRAVRWLRGHVDPAAAAGSALGLVAAVLVVGGAAFGTVLEMVQTKRGFADLDAGAARYGASHATALSTHVLRIITQFGGAVVIVPLAALVGVIEARRSRSWTVVAFLSIVVGGQFLVADVIKAIVGRTRPDVLRLTGFSGPSFPSGHATASAAIFAAFALLIGRGRTRRTRRLLVAAAVAATVLVSATRVLLGVHWLTDVIAGVCLGWTWFAATSIAFGGRRLRLGAPVERAVAIVDSSARATASRSALG